MASCRPHPEQRDTRKRRESAMLNERWPMLTSYDQEHLARIGFPLGGIAAPARSRWAGAAICSTGGDEPPAEGVHTLYSFFALWAQPQGARRLPGCWRASSPRLMMGPPGWPIRPAPGCRAPPGPSMPPTPGPARTSRPFRAGDRATGGVQPDDPRRQRPLWPAHRGAALVLRNPGSVPVAWRWPAALRTSSAPAAR